MTREQILNLANHIDSASNSKEFVALLTEADQLHTRATELRRRAWAIYHKRDEEYSVYA